MHQPRRSINEERIISEDNDVELSGPQTAGLGIGSNRSQQADATSVECGPSRLSTHGSAGHEAFCEPEGSTGA